MSLLDENGERGSGGRAGEGGGAEKAVGPWEGASGLGWGCRWRAGGCEDLCPEPSG